MVKTSKIFWGGYFIIIDDLIIFFKAFNENIETVCKESNSSELKDYKIWCFNGEPRMTLVCTDRFSENGLHEDFFDMDWKHLAVKRPNSPNAEVVIHKPRNYTVMQELAKKLSCNIPFVRIDFYEISGQVYFGEITFFPASGFKGFIPEKWDETLGNWTHLDDCCY